jgi:hypothetical protein
MNVKLRKLYWSYEKISMGFTDQTLCPFPIQNSLLKLVWWQFGPVQGLYVLQTIQHVITKTFIRASSDIQVCDVMFVQFNVTRVFSNVNIFNVLGIYGIHLTYKIFCPVLAISPPLCLFLDGRNSSVTAGAVCVHSCSVGCGTCNASDGRCVAL